MLRRDAYLAKKDNKRGADVTSPPRRTSSPFRRRSSRSVRGCRSNFDRAFMTILVERLSAANLRLSGV